MNNSQLPSNSELSDSISNALSSAFSDNFPDEFITSLKGNLISFNRQEGLDLLQGSDTPVFPLFYSQNPDDNFPNTYAKFANALTTSSDVNLGAITDREVKVIWGRHGSDSLVGFDPGADNVGKRRIDVFAGDFTDEELFASNSGIEGTFREWEDRFILGDRQQPYYVESESDTLGLKQFALITDFNPDRDIIQLHGCSQNYKLVDTDLGTAIFWQQETGYDLIAVVGAVSDLSLESEYFEFKGNSAPADPVLDQAEQIGTASIDYLFSSDVDAQGNLYVAGGTDGSLAESNLGSRDAWLSKYDANGNQLWSKQFGTTGTETIWDIVSDGSNIYVAGNTSSELDNNTTEGGNDIYLAKYDSQGNQVWIKQFGTFTFDESFTLNADSSGNIYVGGHTVGSLGGENQNLGQNLGDPNDPFFGFPSTDSYVVKFDSDGNQVWSEQFGTIALDDNWGVATDKDGNIFAGGNTKGDFGAKNAGEAAEYDPWLVKLDQHGNQQWVEQFGTPDYEFLWDVEADSKGNIYATGWTLGDFTGEGSGSYDTWLTKYDTNGNQLWIKQFGTSGDDAPNFDSIEIDKNNNIYISGYTDSNLGGENAGSYDAWVAKYDEDGNQLWIEQFGTPDYDSATTVTADSYGNLYVSGITEGSLGDTNNGSYDSWIVKLDAETGTILDFTGDNSLANNVFNGSNANDVIQGNAGNDTIYGNGGEDTLTGGNGNNLVYGGSQNDIITAGSGNDTIYGNGGDDYINSGTGADSIWLGTGNATVVLQKGEGYDEIKNFQFGATKFEVSSLDNLSFSDSADGAEIFQGSDLLAVVSWQNANTFGSNIDAIFVA